MADKEATSDLGITSRIRRSSGRGGRVFSATAKLSKDELDEAASAAQRDGKALGEWCRDVLLREARRGCTDTAIFTELMAFRLFANGVLRSLALGKTLTEKEFESLMAEARQKKHLAVTQTLAQYQPTTAGEE